MSVTSPKKTINKLRVSHSFVMQNNRSLLSPNLREAKRRQIVDEYEPASLRV